MIEEASSKQSPELLDEIDGKLMFSGKGMVGCAKFVVIKLILLLQGIKKSLYLSNLN